MAESLLLMGGIGASAVLLLASAFFSSAETAMFSVAQEWIDAEAGTGDRRVRLLQALRSDPHRLLVTLLVGNNVVNVAISSVITVLVVSALPPGIAVVTTTIVTSLVILIFGEIVPKSYGLGNAEDWSLTVAPAVRLVARGLSPLITLLDVLTRRMNAAIDAESAIERPYLD